MNSVNPAIAESVHTELARRWPEGSVSPVLELAGGRSGVTLAAEVSIDDGPIPLAIKAVPPGRRPVGRHDLRRQIRAMRLAREHGIAVPEVLLEHDVPAGGHEGVTFYAMRRVAGEAVEPVLDDSPTDFAPDLVTKRAYAAADMLAAMHAIPGVPGGDEGPEPVATLADELARWRATADAADPEILRHGERLGALLERRLVGHDPDPAFVHGDFRLGNIVFDGAQPTGLIDWEIWGHTAPGIDVGWFLVFCNPELFPGIGAPVRGMPPSSALVERYLASGGRPIDDLPFYEAFGRFKMAAIMAHNLRRHREGRHHDPFQEKLPPTIEQLSVSAIDLIS